MYVEDFPHTYWAVETGAAVDGYQMRPGDVDGLVEWLANVGHTPAAVLMVNGGPAVLLADAGGVVGLGDYAMLTLDGVHAFSADGFGQYFSTEPPPTAPGA